MSTKILTQFKFSIFMATLKKLLLVIMLTGILANSIVFYVSFKNPTKTAKMTPSTFFILR